ncbi:hypothetical protein B0T25DRAFT_220520 [Lasiosphaeria hispida]|uniref:Uncharacterized protein n=1 Tax=Lasiosphaeria hispida TaxID=260671 RepID=A0AAJ0MEP9_9PEZI|nr:hypothetical protein B0T25DRAFT_220520 [Lasiosphaeria hispida]
MGSHADADPTHAVDGLVRAIRDLTSDPNYKLVADVFSEFLFLKDHNHRLSMSHRETMEEYRKFRNELEATKEKLEREKKDLEGTVQDRIQETIQLSASKAALEADLKDTRTSLEHEKKGAAEAAEAALKHATQLADTAAKELAELKSEKEAQLAELQLSKDTELSELQHAKVTELAALQLAKETELAELQADKEAKLAALQTAKDTELAELQAEKEMKLAELQQAKDTELEELQRAKETALAELQLSKVTELATLQTAKDTELAELQAEKEAKLAELQQSKETELADLQAAKEAAIADLTVTKDGEIADLTATKDGEIADLQTAKAAVEEEKKNAEEAAAAAAEVAAQEIASLSEAKAGLETDKANNEAEIVTLKDNVASLEDVKVGLEGVKANNEAELATLKENIATLEQQKKEVEEALEKANAEIESLNATVAQRNTEIESLQESLRAADEQILSLQQTVDEKNGQIDDLHGKLTAEGERADKAIAHGNDIQSKLDETEQTLHLTSGRLQDLEQYRIPLHSENEDVYVTVLDKIWTNIVTLVEGTFRPDIDDQILADPSCWSNLRNSPYLKHATQLQIPLPQSNTPAAKGMRISAVLAVLSRALHRHLFRPVYLLDDEDENLVKFLRILEDEDPTREAHMRATLLSMMPERQMDLGARRVKTVVREVSWLVQHLLSALQFEAFCSGLEQACRLACEQWMRIQMATMKIEPYFGPPYDDFDWQVLELPEFTEAAMRDDDNMTMTDTMTMTAGPTSANGDDTMGDGPLETVEADMPSGGSVSGDADAFHDTASQGHGTLDGHDNGLHGSHMDGSDEGAEDEIEPEEILLVVWPSMCSVEDGGLVSITQGLVISKEQARPALEEVRTRSRLVPRPGSRRARTMSMPAHSRNGSPQRRGPSFLANAQSVAGDAPGDGAPEDG